MTSDLPNIKHDFTTHRATEEMEKRKFLSTCVDSKKDQNVPKLCL